MHGIMSIAELGCERLVEAARFMVRADSGVKAGLRVESTSVAAVIPIMGVIVRREGSYPPYVTDVDEARAAVNAAASDPAVRRIVLKVDSPGGTVDGLHELSAAVAAAAKVKPVTAQVEGMAASAAYWVASQATEIVAGPMDMVGSIGTVAIVTDWSKLAERFGVRVVPIMTGPLKAAGIFGTELTADQEAHFQSIVDAYFADFKAAVARGRRMSAEAVAAVSTGGLFMAKDALRLGLIDRIGGMDSTLGGFAAEQRARAQASRVATLGLKGEI